MIEDEMAPADAGASPAGDPPKGKPKKQPTLAYPNMPLPDSRVITGAPKAIAGAMTAVAGSVTDLFAHQESRIDPSLDDTPIAGIETLAREGGRGLFDMLKNTLLTGSAIGDAAMNAFSVEADDDVRATPLLRETLNNAERTLFGEETENGVATAFKYGVQIGLPAYSALRAPAAVVAGGGATGLGTVARTGAAVEEATVAASGRAEAAYAATKEMVKRVAPTMVKMELLGATVLDPVKDNVANILREIPLPPFKNNRVLESLHTEGYTFEDRLKLLGGNFIVAGLAEVGMSTVGGAYLWAGTDVALGLKMSARAQELEAARRIGSMSTKDYYEAWATLVADASDAGQLTMRHTVATDAYHRGFAQMEARKAGGYQVVAPATNRRFAFPHPDGMPLYHDPKMLSAEERASQQETIDHLGKTWLRASDPQAPALEQVGGNMPRTIFREPGKAVVSVAHANVAEGRPAYVSIMYSDPAVRGTGEATKLLDKARAYWRQTYGEDIAIKLDDLSPMRYEQLQRHGTGGRPVFYMNENTGNFETVVGLPATEKEAQSLAFAYNEAQPPLEMEDLANIQLIKNSITRGKNPYDAENLVRGVGLNFHYLGTTEGANKTLLAMEEAMTERLKQGVVPNAATISEAAKEITGLVDGKEALRRLGLTSDISDKSLIDANIKVKILARRALLRAQAEYASALGDMVAQEGGKNAINVAKLSRVMGAMLDNAEVVQQTASEGGRFLQSLQVSAREVPLGSATRSNSRVVQNAIADDPVAQKDIVQFLDGKTPQEIRLVARLLASTPDNAAVSNIVHVLGEIRGISVEEAAKNPTWWDKFQSVGYNGMLGTVHPQMLNTVGNAVKTTVRPVFALYSAVKHGDEVAMRMAVEQMYANGAELPTAFRAWWQAARTGKPVLDPIMKESGKANFEDFSLPVKILSLGGIPTKGVMATDEFFRSLAYDGFVRSKALRDGMQSGLRGEELGRFIDEALKASRPPGSMAGLDKEAMLMAEENTFVRPFADNSLLQSTTRGLFGNPDDPNLFNMGMRVFFPFHNTPGNIMLDAMELTPGAQLLSRRLQEDMASGGIRAQSAQAKLDAAKMLYAVSALAAGWMLDNGQPMFGSSISQKGSRQDRHEAVSKGERPYTVGGTNHPSFQGLEPFTMMMSNFTDAMAIRDALAVSEADGEEFYSSMIAGIVANQTNKSWLQGMGALEGITSPTGGEEWKKAIANVAWSRMPANGLLSSAANTIDPNFRQARTVLDRIKMKIPLWNETLEPVRSILGEPLMKTPVDIGERLGGPVGASVGLLWHSENGNSDYLQALAAELGEASRLPDISETLNKVDLGSPLTDRNVWSQGSSRGNQSPYDRMYELYGEGSILRVQPGLKKLPPFKDFLDLVRAEDFKALMPYAGDKAVGLMGWNSYTPKATTGSPLTQKMTKQYLLERAFRLYQDAALEQVRKEYPKLDAAFKRAEVARRTVNFQSQTTQTNSVLKSFLGVEPQQ